MNEIGRFEMRRDLYVEEGIGKLMHALPRLLIFSHCEI
jgi:hypothetical protein